MSGIDKDNFEAAFDSLATLGDGQQPKFDETPAADAPAAAAETAELAQEPADTAAAADAGDDGAADGADAVDAGDADAAAGADDATDAAAAAAPVGGTPPTPEQQALSRFTELLERQERERQEYAEQQRHEQMIAQQQAQTQDDPLFSEEDIAKLTEFKQEWPDVMDAMQRAQRAQGKLFTQLLERRVTEALMPFQSMLQTLATRSHLTDIQTAIPEYDTTRDKVIEWARSDNHPKYLRDAYESVIREGTAEDIKHLFQQYQAATGQVSRPAPAPRQRNTELPAAAKQAAASLAPVGSQRSAASTSATPENFEDAFRQWAGMDL